MDHHGEEVIKLKSVKKIYLDGKFAALNGVDLSIRKREYVVVMGRSGSGKSTLLHLMGCLDTPSEGQIYISGVKTSEMSEDELARIRREKIGFVFQSFNLIANLDALRNVALPMMFEGISKEEREKRAKALLEDVGLANHIYSYPNEMSGGERQRVAIARALANEPEIILADEPTGNLDSVSAEQVLNIMDKLHEKIGMTVVIVTHEKYVAERGERIITMKDGIANEGMKIKGRG